MSVRRVDVLRWLLGIALILALLWGIDAGEVLVRLRTAEIWLATAAVVGLTGIHLIGAVTWRVLVSRLSGRAIPWRSAVATYYKSQGFGAITPASVGSDGFRIVALRRAGIGVDIALTAAVVQRGTSVLSVSVLALAAAFLVASTAEPPFEIIVVAVTVALALLVLALVILMSRRVANGVLMRVITWIGIEPWSNVAPTRPSVSLAVPVALSLILGLAFHTTGILLTYVAVLAVNPAAPPVAALAAIAMTRLSLAVPTTPSAIGVQEGFLVILFGRLGMFPGDALAALLISRVALITTVGIGTIAFAARGFQSADPSRTEARETPRPG